MKIFKGLSNDEINDISQYFEMVHVNKNDYICHEGDYIDSLYIVLEGKIEISRYDLNGHKNMIGIMSVNDMFAESIVLSNQKQTHVNIMALRKSKLLKITKEKIFSLNNTTLLKNLLEITASKNIVLNKKINCIGKKTVREKLFEYLKNESINNQSLVLEMDFNINQLADYLCINRSSLSREISHMIDDDYFKIENNKYILNNKYFKM